MPATVNIVKIFEATIRSVSVFGIWGSVDLIGAFIVFIGCAGELWLLLNKLPEHNERREFLKGFWKLLDWAESKIRPIGVRLKIIRQRKFSDLKEHLLEGLFISLVAVGVAMELTGLPFALIASAELNAKADDAKEGAALANAKAEGFRLKADELEAQLRGINPANLPLASAKCPLRSNSM